MYLSTLWCLKSLQGDVSIARQIWYIHWDSLIEILIAENFGEQNPSFQNLLAKVSFPKDKAASIALHTNKSLSHTDWTRQQIKAKTKLPIFK